MAKTLHNMLLFNGFSNGAEMFQLFPVFDCHARFNQNLMQSSPTSSVLLIVISDIPITNKEYNK